MGINAFLFSAVQPSIIHLCLSWCSNLHCTRYYPDQYTTRKKILKNKFVTQKPNIFNVVSHKTSFKSDPGCNFLFSGFPVSSPIRETNKTKPNIYTDPSKQHALKREEKFNK